MHDRIEIKPSKCHGKPVIRNTRVLVSTILGALAGGDTVEMILADYPNIDEDDVQAALAFAGGPDTLDAADEIMGRYRNALRELAN